MLLRLTPPSPPPPVPKINLHTHTYTSPISVTHHSNSKGSRTKNVSFQEAISIFDVITEV